MTDIKSIFGMRENKQNFFRPERQSIEQAEDYAIKKVVYTQELIVGGVPYGGTAGIPHAPTTYRGTDFTGTNPNKQLVHSRNLIDSMQLFIGGRMMIRDIEYTIVGAVKTITMIDTIIDDTDYIVVCD